MQLKARIKNVALKNHVPAQAVLQNFMLERLLVSVQLGDVTVQLTTDFAAQERRVVKDMSTEVINIMNLIGFETRPALCRLFRSLLV